MLDKYSSNFEKRISCRTCLVFCQPNNFWHYQLNLLVLLMGSQVEHHNAMMCQHKTLIYNRSAGITMGNNQIARAAISPVQIKVYKIATIGD